MAAAGAALCRTNPGRRPHRRGGMNRRVTRDARASRTHHAGQPKKKAEANNVAPARLRKSLLIGSRDQKAMRAVTRAPWVLRSDARVPL